MRPRGTKTQLEQRRREAAALRDRGLTHATIARRLGTTVRSVERWMRARREGGPSALAARTGDGRPARLAPRQQQALVRTLRRGARRAGFDTDDWTCRQVARVIRDRFGVTYRVASIPRLLKRLGFRA